MARKKSRPPQEKKALSYAKDCRNTYGQNDKAARRLIPLLKAKEKRQARKNAQQEVTRLPRLDEEAAEVVESSARAGIHRKGWRWRKCPDKPLGQVLDMKKSWS